MRNIIIEPNSHYRLDYDDFAVFVGFCAPNDCPVAVTAIVLPAHIKTM